MPEKDPSRSGDGKRGPATPSAGPTAKAVTATGPTAQEPTPEELTAEDLALLGAQPLRRSDPRDIGPYRVLARLGGGGMGRLYLGRDASVEGTYASPSLVAVKVIRSDYAEDEGFRRRFGREIEAVRRVHGAYTAELLGSGLDRDELLWMATAYVPGLSLADAVLRYGPMPVPLVRRLAFEIGQALTAIAGVGIVHRDLKPANVLLGVDGARVIDFGVAHTTDASSLTMTGQHLGTPAFMSPEQANGGEVGTASDIFSLGSVLTLAATGSAPFGGGSTVDVIHRLIYSPPSEQVLARIATHDPEFAELVGRCLDKDPERRPTPQEVVDATREFALGEEWPQPVSEVIGARDGWSGRTVAVSPVDQLTILRRTAPEPARQQAAPKRRRALILAAAATVVVASAAAVFAVLGTGGGAADAGRTVRSGARPDTSASASAPAGSHTASPPAKHRTPSTHGPAATHTEAPPPHDTGAGGYAPGAPPPWPQQPGGTYAPAPPPHTTKAPSAPKAPAPKPKPASKPWKSCAYYSGTALTRYGSTGSHVKEVQCILKARTYDIGSGGVDGIFGAATRTAVKRFQSNHHLYVDGEVGEDTWHALRA